MCSICGGDFEILGTNKLRVPHMRMVPQHARPIAVAPIAFFGPGQLCRGTLHSCSFERPVAVGKNANKLCRGDSELLTKHFLDQDQNRKGMGDNIEGGLQIEKVVVPFTT